MAPVPVPKCCFGERFKSIMGARVALGVKVITMNSNIMVTSGWRPLLQVTFKKMSPKQYKVRSKKLSTYISLNVLWKGWNMTLRFYYNIIQRNIVIISCSDEKRAHQWPVISDHQPTCKRISLSLMNICQQRARLICSQHCAPLIWTVIISSVMWIEVPWLPTGIPLIIKCHNSGQFPLIVIFTTGKVLNQFQGHICPGVIVRC